jgi:hypothetical protein
MHLYKSPIFLFLLLVSSSLIFPYRCSLFLFLNVLLVSRLKFCRLSPLVWLGFCNHCNLACFRWSINCEHSSSNHGLLCFILYLAQMKHSIFFPHSWFHTQTKLFGFISVDFDIAHQLFFNRHLQSFADLWPTLMGFSIYI